MVLSPTADEHWADLLAIAAAISEAFDTVFADFVPFRGRRLEICPPSGAPMPADGISVVYPDTSPAQVSWVEPSAPRRGAPKMRLKHRSSDPRLLGDGGAAATLIPHELAHALHFWLMPRRWRIWIETRYAGWIAGQLARGRDGGHSAEAVTSPLVAWLESFGLFAERYWRFAQHHRGSATDTQQSFVEHEMQLSPVTSPEARGDRQQHSEGVVYRQVFVEYASRTSLATAVSLYLLSGTRGVTSYAGFASALANSPVPPKFSA